MSTTVKERFWAKVDLFFGITDEDCWNWVGAMDYQTRARFLFNGKNERASRVVWILYRGAIPASLWVLHKCDNPSCVNPSHLYLGTRTDNIRDCVMRGRHPSKIYFTPQQIQLIKESQKSQRELAKQLGVCQTVISYIKSGRKKN